MITCPFDKKRCNAFDDPKYLNCRYEEHADRTDDYIIPPCIKLSEKQVRGGYTEYPEILEIIKERERKKKSSKSKSKRNVCKCKK